MVGFSDRVNLGDVGALRTDPALALRFTFINPPEADTPERLTLRLRGTAFDHYDGLRWLRSINAAPRAPITSPSSTLVAPLYRAPSSTDRRIAIDLEPIDPPVVFIPPRSVALSVSMSEANAIAEPPTLLPGPEGEIRYQGRGGQGLRYEAYLAGERESLIELLAPESRARYLKVPDDTPLRMGSLVRDWTAGITSPYLRAKAIEEHLRKEFTYSLSTPSGSAPYPVDHFLFESRQGHCEFFFDCNGTYASRNRHSVAQCHGLCGWNIQPIRTLLRRSRGGRPLVGRVVLRCPDS